MSSKKCQYVRLRLEEELGSREAARRVEFAGGVPSPGARELYREAQLAREFGVGSLEERISELQARLASLKNLSGGVDF